MVFYDFEVFKYDWLVVILDMDNQKEHVIINNPSELEAFYQDHVNDIWVGFNSRGYDQFILKSILCGLNPKECNDHIILKGQSGYSFSRLFNQYPLNNYDVMQNIDRGLKVFEGFLGSNIKETSVPFDIDRKLTPAEIRETVKYCRHDVEQTVLVFIERKSDFEAQMELLKMYQMPLSYINKTKVQLSAEILGATKHVWDDEFDISLPPCARVEKYTDVPAWFMNPENHRYKIGNKSNKLEKIMAGIPMTFAWGGVHGAKKSYHAKGYFINMDVGSLYPTIDCLFPEYCFSRAVSPEGLERYKEILRFRLQLKAEGKKKEQAPFKIVLNGTYGAMKDKYNKLYDPRGANNTCVFGQILVGVDLLERLEGVCEIIQVNTDGILIRMNSYDDFDLIDDIAFEWEQRTGLSLEFDDYGWGEIFQKDVNNYLIMDEWGHYKSKGEYVKGLGSLDYDLPIVNTALVKYMTKGIPIETTVLECDDLKEFQQVKKITSKYECIYHGGTFTEQTVLTNKGTKKKVKVYNNDGKQIKETCVRVFASVNHRDGTLYKKHAVTGGIAKIDSCPEHCFIFNDEVNGVSCPDLLDKQWYVDLAKDRLKGFGVRL